MQEFDRLLEALIERACPWWNHEDCQHEIAELRQEVIELQDAAYERGYDQGYLEAGTLPWEGDSGNWGTA